MFDMKEIIELAKAKGYSDPLENNVDLFDLVMIREWLRLKHKIHVEINQDERGSANHKTKEFFSCSITRREPNKKGLKFIASVCYRTFDTYEESLEFGISRALKKLGKESIYEIEKCKCCSACTSKCCNDV